MTERLRIAAAVVIASVGLLIIYFPSLNGGFVWDDALHLRDTPAIQAADGLRRIWLTTECRDYYPLSHSMLWLEWHLWGYAVVGYHVTNVLLHALGAVALWRLLKKLELPAAWIGAVLFAVHPVNVPSVAWISELKNVLAFPFATGAALAYLNGKRGLSWLCFAAALFAKPAMVGLPAALLALTWWRQGRLERRDWLRALPLAGAAVLLGAVTVWFQRYRALEERVVLSTGLLERVMMAAGVVWFYFFKAVAPFGLSLIYSPWPAWLNSVAMAGLAGVAALLRRQRQSWGRGGFATLVCFVALLFPVLGFFDQGYYRFSPVADHWLYFALPVVCAGANWTIGRLRYRSVVTAGLAVGLAFAASERCRAFQDDEQFWQSALRSNPRAWIAEYQLGNHLARRQDPSALEHFLESIRIDSQYGPSHYNAAILLAQQGRFAEATAHMEQACRLEPGRASGHVKLAQLYLALQQPDRAAAEFREALRLNPSDAAAQQAMESLTASGHANDGR